MSGNRKWRIEYLDPTDQFRRHYGVSHFYYYGSDEESSMDDVAVCKVGRYWKITPSGVYMEDWLDISCKTMKAAKLAALMLAPPEDL